MSAVSPTAPTGVLHARATEFTTPMRGAERRFGLLFAGTGIGLIVGMGVLGLVMRLTQATVIGLSPAWFYRLLTLHGVGMITGALLAMMGALWYVLNPVVPLRQGRMLAAYSLVGAGAVAVLVATMVGGFGASWTFLPPLPFYPVGQWPVWSESVWFIGNMLVGTGFAVFCVDVLEQTTTRYGGLTRTLGWQYLRGRDQEAPPPQVIAATVVAIDGLLAAAVGSAVVTGLLGRTYDQSVGIDALVTKNLVYFFGHSIANLAIYLGAAVVYVIIPRYAGRPYHTSKVFVAGWAGSLIFIVTAYSHHLYMDFVQPSWAQVISEATSYGALIPVAVITIYSMTMLVWGSRYRWTLASTLFYAGLSGWAIGGVGAVIDSLIPFNFRLHNTVWVVAHFHTYELLTVVVWILAFLAHVIERDAGRTASSAARAWIVGLILVGGYGFTGTWFVAGALGIPRRYAIQPAGTIGYSVAGASFALVLALGFLLYFIQLAPLARTAWNRRHFVLVDHTDGWTGGHYEARVPRAEAGTAAADAPASPIADASELPRRGLPLETRAQFGFAAAACVVGLAAFLPQVVDASEVSNRYHHLDHAGHFFFGAIVGLLLGSLPWVSRRLGDRRSLGLATALIAPMAMMLVMVPRIYEPLEANPFHHALFHVAMAAFGFVTGVSVTRLGLVTGRVMFILAVGMPLMFAAAFK